MSEPVDNAPVSSGQFVSFEKLAAGALLLVVSFASIVWFSRVDTVDKRFEAVDKRFDGVDKRLDKIEEQLGRLVVSMTKVETQMNSLVAASHKVADKVSDNEKAIVALNTRVTTLKNK